MKEFITALDPNYQLDKYYIKDNVAVFHIRFKINEIKYPYCSALSSKVYSTYEREIQDFPMQNRKAILIVKTRKMFCSNCQCEKKIFSEYYNTRYVRMPDLLMVLDIARSDGTYRKVMAKSISRSGRRTYLVLKYCLQASMPKAQAM